MSRRGAALAVAIAAIWAAGGARAENLAPDATWFQDEPGPDRSAPERALFEAFCASLLRDKVLWEGRSAKIMEGAKNLRVRLESGELGGLSSLVYQVPYPVAGASAEDREISLDKAFALEIKSEHCGGEKGCSGCWGRLPGPQALERLKDLLAQEASVGLQMPYKLEWWGERELTLRENGALSALARELMVELVKLLGAEYIRGPSPVDLLRLSQRLLEQAAALEKAREPARAQERARLALLALTLYDPGIAPDRLFGKAPQGPVQEEHGWRAVGHRLWTRLNASFSIAELRALPEPVKPGYFPEPPARLTAAANERLAAGLKALAGSKTGAAMLAFHRHATRERAPAARPARLWEAERWPGHEPTLFDESSGELVIHPRLFAAARPKALAALIFHGLTRKQQSLRFIPLDFRALLLSHALTAIVATELELSAEDELDWDGESAFLATLRAKLPRERKDTMAMEIWLRERTRGLGVLNAVEDRAAVHHEGVAARKLWLEGRPAFGYHSYEPGGADRGIAQQAVYDGFRDAEKERRSSFNSAFAIRQKQEETGRNALFGLWTYEAYERARNEKGRNDYVEIYYHNWNCRVKAWFEQGIAPDFY